MTMVSKAFASTTVQMAFDTSLTGGSAPRVKRSSTSVKRAVAAGRGKFAIQ